MLETIVLGLVTTVTLVYLYLRHHYNYWRRKGVQQPPVVYGFGNYLDVVLMKDNPGFIYDRAYRSYSGHDAVGLYDFLKPKLILRSPELIKRVMVSDFSSFHDNEFYVTKKLDPHVYMDPFCIKGEEWKPARAKLQASMASSRLKEIYPVMKEILPRLDAFLEEHLGEDFEAKELATLFTMDNVSNVAFGINSNCFTDPNAAFRKICDMMIKESLQRQWRTILLFVMPKIRDLIGMSFTPKVVIDYMENMVHEVVDYRRKNELKRNDLLHHLMKKDTGNDQIDEILFISMTMFFEAFESSSMVASTALYELALNPEIEQRVYEEVRDAFGDKADPDYETINNNLPYLDKVLQEAMRKYSVLYSMIRVCNKTIELEIDGKPVEISPGTSVVVPLFSLHRDPQYYPDPEVFDPERFSEENKRSRPPYTNMPFGEGPRICPGIKFAMIQMKLLISYLVYKYRIVRCEKTPQKLTFATGAYLVTPNEQEWFRLEKRK